MKPSIKYKKKNKEKGNPFTDLFHFYSTNFIKEYKKYIFLYKQNIKLKHCKGISTFGMSRVTFLLCFPLLRTHFFNC